MLAAARGVLNRRGATLLLAHSKLNGAGETMPTMIRAQGWSTACSTHHITSGAVISQRRFHATLGGSNTSQQPSASNAPPAAAVPSTAGKPDQEAIDNLLDEIQVVLSRPVPIGALFRALSSASKKTLARNKEPLEQLLLRYPEHFAVYQQGSNRNRTIHCAPLHLVPANVRRLVLEESSVPAVASSASESKNPADIHARILKHDPLAEKQQRINTVLQYIPNEWSPFTDLGIPEEVRVKCMGKPSVKAFQYFEKYPQYFEVRQQGLAEHTFYVRRSLALQRNLEKSP
ncbi:hypothetical protein DQ04_01111000 [Trypanosoma grayi]|uniref:hypothetical protein n=1 Tax=Trypanosoma grayi TaxID=71804 RepID=UPI0004F4B022|nr:hypothetical protein DQ04_01111000 [Trypanosoma grayi]KEG13263.1 hypothetical protein DQ04_01111000 [Trypanosoma grayi]